MLVAIHMLTLSRNSLRRIIMPRLHAISSARPTTGLCSDVHGAVVPPKDVDGGSPSADVVTILVEPTTHLEAKDHVLVRLPYS